MATVRESLPPSSPKDTTDEVSSVVVSSPIRREGSWRETSVLRRSGFAWMRSKVMVRRGSEGYWRRWRKKEWRLSVCAMISSRESGQEAKRQHTVAESAVVEKLMKKEDNVYIM